MIRKEAIEMLKALNMMLRNSDGEPISDVCDALDMAIEALQTPPISQRSMYQAGYRQAQADMRGNND